MKCLKKVRIFFCILLVCNVSVVSNCSPISDVSKSSKQKEALKSSLTKDGENKVIVETMLDMTGKEAQAFYTGLSTFIWGYPIVFTEQLQRDRVNASAPGVPQAAVNQFGTVRDIRGPEYKVIAAPNNDTLYAHAFLDLREEPIIFTVPKIESERYYSFQLWDPYQVTFKYIGTRTTGNDGGVYAIVGPDWQGTLPNGVERIDALDNLTVIWGRIGGDGTKDIENARAIQDGLTLIPLSLYGKINTNPEPNMEKSKERVAIDIPSDLPKELQFFTKLAKALKYTKPREDDKVVYENLYRIGITEDFEFNYKALSEEEVNGLLKAVKVGNMIIDHEATTAGTRINGWNYSDKAGYFGTNYIFRAATAKWYTGANIPEEAIYMSCRTDDKGSKLSGESEYIINFDKGEYPPGTAFWSLTMYDESDGSLVENTINRYSIGDRTEGLLYNEDGSLSIYVQNKNPGEGKNWLPAPKGEFNLMLRLYIPDDSLKEGTWAPPKVKKLK